MPRRRSSGLICSASPMGGRWKPVIPARPPRWRWSAPPKPVMVTGQTQALALGAAGAGAGAGGRAGGESRAEQERQRRIRRMVILLVTLLVVLAVIAFFLVRALTTTEQVTVPIVAGQTLAQATQTLQNDNLAVGATSSKTSSNVAKGHVISSDPAAGRQGEQEQPGRSGRQCGSDRDKRRRALRRRPAARRGHPAHHQQGADVQGGGRDGHQAARNRAHSRTRPEVPRSPRPRW